MPDFVAQVEQRLQRALHYIEHSPELYNGQHMAQAATLTALAGIPGADDVRQALAHCLATVMDEQWVGNAEFTELFTVLNAIHHYDASKISGNLLANAAKRLLAAESAVGGPYYTRKGVVDTAANVQVALFVNWAAAPLPHVTHMIEHVIATKAFDGTDLTSFALLYYMAQVGKDPRIAEAIGPRDLIGAWTTPQQTALAINVLLQYASHKGLAPAARYLLHTQQHDGSWPAETFRHNPTSLTSELLTTALATQALARYIVIVSEEPVAHLAYDDAYRRVFTTTRHGIRHLPKPLQPSTITALDNIEAADKNQEITLLPTFFADALMARPHSVTPAICDQLGMANIYCWAAYTTYDNILDGEKVVHMLPAANVAMRAALYTYRRVGNSLSAFQPFIERVFTDMDSANTWEATHCRLHVSRNSITFKQLPRYGQCSILADRAFAHALGPMAVLALSGFGPSSPHGKAIQKAFRHYLIARQLNDDLHDWREDLQAGTCSYVVRQLFRDLHLQPGTYPKTMLITTMQHHFRLHVLGNVSSTIRTHLQQSRAAFNESGLLRPANNITALLDTIDASVSESLVLQQQGQSFLTAYA